MADGSLNFDTQLDNSGFDKGVKKLTVAGVAAAKAIAASLAGAVTAFGKLTYEAGQAYAETEQLIGGVKTLFGTEAKSLEEYAASVGKAASDVRGEYSSLISAQNEVLKNADDAYKTAGMSANTYMSTVTSFSASLISSLEGDTKAAAAVADRAILDMADNANKMGSDLESIRTAYTSFSRGSFVLLDNLKLGYGGTQEEMKRLLADAEKLTGIKYDISNFSDIINAIHAIQEEMGITGTTAKEASGTISGSVASMKAAFVNFLSGTASETANVEKLTNQLIDSVTTVITNIQPVINRAIPNLLDGLEALGGTAAEYIPVILNDMLPMIIRSMADFLSEAIIGLADQVSQNSDNITTLSSEIITLFVSGILSALPRLSTAAVEIVGGLLGELLSHAGEYTQAGVDIVIALGNGLSDALPELVPVAVDAVLQIVNTLLDNVDLLGDAAYDIIMALADGLISEGSLNNIANQAPVIINKIVTALIDLASDIFDLGISLAAEIVMGISDYDFKGNMQSVYDKLYNIGADMHRSLIDGYNQQVRTENTEFISQFANHTKSELMQMNADLSDELAKYEKAWSELEGYDNVDEYLKYHKQSENGVIINSLKEKAEKENVMIADLYNEQIRHIREQQGLIMDAVSNGEYMEEPVSSVMNGYAANAKAKHDNPELWGIPQEYIKGNDAIINSAKKTTTANEEETEKQSKSEKTAADIAKEQREKEWETIEHYNQLGLYSDQEAQEQRLKWIQKYCPEYSDEWYQYYKEVYDYQVEAERESLEATQKSLEEQGEIVKEKLSEIADEYDEKFDEIQNRISDYKNKMLSVGSLFTIEEKENEDGTKTKSYTVNNIAERLAQMKSYHSSLLKLRDMGAPSSLISEIMNLGYVDGAYLAEQLANDPKFAEFKALYEELDKEAQRMAEEFYSPDMQALNQSTSQAVYDAYSALPEEMRNLGKEAVTELIEGMAEVDVATEIQKIINGINPKVTSEVDYNFKDFTEQQKSYYSGAGYDKAFNTAEYKQAAQTVQEIGSIIASEMMQIFPKFTERPDNKTINLEAALTTVVQLDGKTLGQAVTEYQLTEQRKGDY